jgi:hypothetical protein
MVGWIELFVFAGLIGLLIGIFAFRNQEKGKQADTAKLPIMGPMLAYEYWWPTNAHDKNILVNKFNVILFMALAAFTSPYVYLFVALPFLFNFEYFDESNDEQINGK